MSEDEEENGIENCSIWVKQWVDMEGMMRYTVRQSGDVPMSTQVGLLELAKQMLLKDHP